MEGFYELAQPGDTVCSLNREAATWIIHIHKVIK